MVYIYSIQLYYTANNTVIIIKVTGYNCVGMTIILNTYSTHTLTYKYMYIYNIYVYVRIGDPRTKSLTLVFSQSSP